MRMHTLMMRLVPHEKNALNYDDMGASEYEFGSCHKALNLLLCDPHIPVETVETEFRLNPSDVLWTKPTRASGPSGKRYYEKSAADFGRLMGIADGQRMLFRHAPAASDPDALASFLPSGGLPTS